MFGQDYLSGHGEAHPGQYGSVMEYQLQVRDHIDRVHVHSLPRMILTGLTCL
jgi:hypothetical protein